MPLTETQITMHNNKKILSPASESCVTEHSSIHIFFFIFFSNKFLIYMLLGLGCFQPSYKNSDKWLVDPIFDRVCTADAYCIRHRQQLKYYIIENLSICLRTRLPLKLAEAWSMGPRALRTILLRYIK